MTSRHNPGDGGFAYGSLSNSVFSHFTRGRQSGRRQRAHRTHDELSFGDQSLGEVLASGLDISSGSSTDGAAGGEGFADELPLKTAIALEASAGQVGAAAEAFVSAATSESTQRKRAPSLMVEVSADLDPTTCDGELGTPRAVLAILGISTDLVVDSDGALLIRNFPGVVLRQTKCAMAGEEICAESFIGAYESGMLQHAIESLKYPIGYNSLWGVACTSMSFLLGPERCRALFSHESDGKGGLVPYTDMMSAVLAGLNVATEAAFRNPESTGRRRIAVLTPYVSDVHATNLQRLREEGFSVVAAMNLGFSRDELTSALSPSSIAGCVERLVAGAGGAGKLDAVFIGCSAFRAMGPGFISDLEAKIGVTVITSMQAFFWHMLRTTGVEDQIEGYGQLFLEH